MKGTAGLAHMILQQGNRPWNVAVATGGKKRAMFGVGTRGVVQPSDRHAQVAVGGVVQQADMRKQAGPFAGLVKRQVKRLVEIAESGERRCFQLILDRGGGIDPPVRQVGDRMAQGHRLGHHAHLVDLGEITQIDGRDHCAAIAHQFDETFGLQQAQRLAHGHPAGAELGRELLLAQRHAGREGAAHDALAQVRGNAPGLVRSAGPILSGGHAAHEDVSAPASRAGSPRRAAGPVPAGWFDKSGAISYAELQIGSNMENWMTVSRLQHIPGINVDRMGNAADALGDPSILRLENLDTDIPPPAAALRATREAVGADNANSYLPFLGQHALRRAAVARISADTGVSLDPERNCIVSAGGLSGVLNTLLAILEPGDEVIITDPAYAGLLNRIRLAGGVPKLVPLTIVDGGWRLDLEALARARGPRTRAVLTMSPSMPSGIVHTREEWEAICTLVRESDAWLVHDAAMERILYTRQGVLHPLQFEGMAECTVTVGSVSKEYRMIGWRVGWIVGPERVMNDIGLVSLTNVVCQVGIAMPGAAAALTDPDDGVEEAVATWRGRRDLILDELADLPVVRPDGGWSLLLDTQAMGIAPERASALLLERGGIAATAMTGWGEKDQAGRFLRFVFANEPVERLVGLRERLRRAWGT